MNNHFLIIVLFSMLICVITYLLLQLCKEGSLFGLTSLQDMLEVSFFV